MHPTDRLLLGFFCLTSIAYTNPLPQGAGQGQPLFSVVSPSSTTVEANAASSTTSAASSLPSAKSREEFDAPDRVISAGVYAEGPPNAPPVTVSYNNSTGSVVVVFEDQKDTGNNDEGNRHHHHAIN